MPSALFIGGFADGRWIDVPDGVEVWAVQEFLDADSDPSVEFAAFETRVHTYKADSLACRTDRWRLFVPSNFDDGRDWIPMLLRGYRQPMSEPEVQK